MRQTDPSFRTAGEVPVFPWVRGCFKHAEGQPKLPVGSVCCPSCTQICLSFAAIRQNVPVPYGAAPHDKTDWKNRPRRYNPSLRGTDQELHRSLCHLPDRLMDRREGWDGRLCNQGVIKTNDSKIFRYPDSLRRSTLKHLGGDDIRGRKNPIHRIAPPRFFQKVRNARIVILLV